MGRATRRTTSADGLAAVKKRPPSPWKLDRAALVRRAIGAAPAPPDDAETQTGVQSRSVLKRLAVMNDDPMPTHFPPPDEPPPTVMRKPVRFGPRRAA